MDDIVVLYCASCDAEVSVVDEHYLPERFTWSCANPYERKFYERQDGD